MSVSELKPAGLSPSKTGYASSYTQGGAPSSSATALPQFLSAGNRHRSSKSASSILRLSRTNTNTTDYQTPMTPEDNRSITDRVPSARPAVTNADKIWTKIDVLDDVKMMADDVKMKGSFFNEKFDEELVKLKEAQNELLNQMAIYQARRKEDESYKNLEATQDKEPVVTTEDTEQTTDTREARELQARRQMETFFKPQQRNILHRKQDLNDIENYVEDVRENLEKVGLAIKNFDDTTKDLW